MSAIGLPSIVSRQSIDDEEEILGGDELLLGGEELLDDGGLLLDDDGDELLDDDSGAHGISTTYPTPKTCSDLTITPDSISSSQMLYTSVSHEPPAPGLGAARSVPPSSRYITRTRPEPGTLFTRGEMPPTVTPTMACGSTPLIAHM
jgi:hypothetical protein